MITKVQRWGNSQGLRLAKQLLQEAHISVGDEVSVTTKDGSIVISPARKARAKQTLKELVSRIPKNHQPAEADWGEPMGKEAW